MNVRPRPHVPGMTNAAVKPDAAPSTKSDAAPTAVPKMLRNPRMIAAARQRAARDDRMRYIRTDVDAGGGGTKAGDAVEAPR